MGKEHEFLLALRQGNVEQARKIMAKLKKAGTKKKVNVNVQDEQGHSALHHCASNGYTDLAKDIVDYGGVVMLGDSKGMSALHLASFGGHYEVALTLLMRYSDANAASRTGDTPLHLASQYGHHRVVEALLDNKANCNLLNVSGQTPLDLSCQHGQATVVHMLLKSGQCQPRAGVLQTPLHLAAKHGHVDCLRLLIQHGYNVNTPGLNGTCLHEAALYGKIDVVKFLLQAGSDVTCTNGQGLTPLDVVDQYTDPRSSQDLRNVLKDATYAAQRKVYYSHQQQQQPASAHQFPHQQQQPQQPAPPQPHLQLHQQQQPPPQHLHKEPAQQPVGASPQQQAYYHQQQQQLHADPSRTGPSAQHQHQHHHHLQHQQQQQQHQQRALQQPNSYVNMDLGSEQPPRGGISRDRAPSLDNSSYRPVKPVGIGGNANLASQIASLASKRSFKGGSPPRMGHAEGGFDDVQMRTQRSHTIAAIHHTGGYHTSTQNPPLFRPAPPPGEREPDSAYSTLANDSPLIHEVREGLRMGHHHHQPYSPTNRTSSVTNSSSMNSISSDPENSPSDFAAMLLQGKGVLRTTSSVQEPASQPPPGPPQAQPGAPQGQPGGGGAGGFAEMIAQGKGILRKAHTVAELETVSDCSSTSTGGGGGGENFAAMILQSKDTLRRSKKIVERPPKQEEPEVSNELMSKLLRRQQKAEEDPEPSGDPPPTDPHLPAPAQPQPTQEISPEAVPEPVAVSGMVRRNSKSQTPPTVAPKHPSPQQPPAKKGAPAPPLRLTPTLDAKGATKAPPPPAEVNEFQQVFLRRTKNKEESHLSASDSDSSLTIQGSPPVEKKQGPPTARKSTAGGERKGESQETPSEQQQQQQQQHGLQSRSDASIFSMTAGMRVSAELPESPLVTDVHSSTTNRNSGEEASIFSQVILKKKEKKREARQAQKTQEPEAVQTSGQTPFQTSGQTPFQTSTREPVETIPPPATIPAAAPPTRPYPQTAAPVTKQPSPPLQPVQPPAPVQVPSEPVTAASRSQMSVFEITRKKSLESKRPQEVNPPRPQEVNPPRPQEVNHPRPQEVNQPCPQEVQPPRPQEVQLPPAAVPPAQTTSVETISHLAPPTPKGLISTKISDWLASVKLTDYIDLFVQEGFTTTDLVIGLSGQELIDLGMSKIGHRKRFLAALESLPSEDAQPTHKPTDVGVWLACIGLAEYTSALVDAGYDEIEYISDISEGELKDIGVCKRGHLRKLHRAIDRLGSLPEGPAPPASTQPPPRPPATATSGPVQDSLPALLQALPPPPCYSSTKEPSPVPSAVEKTKQMISQASSSSSLDRDEAYGSEDSIAKSTGSAEQDMSRKKSFTSGLPSSSFSSAAAAYTRGQAVAGGVHSQDRLSQPRPISGGLEPDEFTMSDITGVLDQALNHKLPLQSEEDSKTDELMCELDDMLANLSSQIDIIIPGSGQGR